jgi:hypothetical protein
MKYAKSADGLIHLISAVNSDYTICGDAYDGENGDCADSQSWGQCKSGPVTCPKCAAQIRQCRGVRTTAPTADAQE